MKRAKLIVMKIIFLIKQSLEGHHFVIFSQGEHAQIIHIEQYRCPEEIECLLPQKNFFFMWYN